MGWRLIALIVVLTFAAHSQWNAYFAQLALDQQSSLLLTAASSSSSTASARSSCADPHTAPDGGDCDALEGERLRPDWACFSEMRAAIPDFVRLYAERPVRDNTGGMRLDHSFALFYILRQLNPQVVVESGAFRGHSTWLIRQALPQARIISLDPSREPDQPLADDKVDYMLLSNWKDLSQVDWKAKGVDPEETLIFVDDHQSAYRRALLEMRPMGFRRFIFEDNYPFPNGDNMSFKWVCEVQDSVKEKWPITVPDDFNRKSMKISWEHHVKQAHYLPKILQTYYEFPPVATTELSGQTRFDVDQTSRPIVTDQDFFETSGLAKLDRDEFNSYTHIAYVELKSGVAEDPPALASSVRQTDNQ